MILSDGCEAITLDLKENTYKEIEVHQLDTTILNFNIVNYGVAVDLTNYDIELRCAKPDGSYVVQNTNITKNSSGQVKIECISDIVSYAGNAKCELRLTNSTGMQITTFNIVLVVKASVLDGINQGESVLVTALEELNDALSEISDATITAISGKVKMDSESGSDYLGNFLDGITIQNVNGKLVAKYLDGMTSTIAQIDSAVGNSHTHSNKAYLDNITGDVYTQMEVDNKISILTSGLDWKESVNTYSDIATVYPTPDDGWTVNVKDTDITYRYNGTTWIPISANSIPLVTQSVDGKMGASDKTKLDGITGTNTGDETTATIQTKLGYASNATSGYLIASDWNKFNNKANASHIHSISDIYTLQTVLDGKAKINDSSTTGNTTETYSIDKILTLLSSKQDNILIQSSEPTTGLVDKLLWIQTGVTPLLFLEYDLATTSFKQIGSNGNTINNWISSTNYNINDLVIYSNKIYQCSIANSDTNFTIGNWSLIGVNIDDNSTSTTTTYSSSKTDSTYVKKETGKSLISDMEIERLASVVNYDDTNMQTHINNNTVHVTFTDKLSWNRMDEVINLLDVLSTNVAVSDENGNNITDENMVAWTM